MGKKLLITAGLLTLSTAIWAQDLKMSVNEKSKVGYTDASGKTVIKQIYDSGTAFQNGYAKVSKGKKFGFIDATGKEVLPIKYDDIQEWGNGLYLATSGNIKSLVKPDGTMVLAQKLTHISKPNMYGKAWIAMGGKVSNNVITGCKYGIIDDRGKVLVDATNKGIFEFSRKWDNKNSAFGVSMIPTASMLTIKDTLKTDCKYLIASDNPAANKNGALIDGSTGTVIIPKKTYTFMTTPKDGMVRYYIWDKKTTTYGYYDIENKKDIRVNTLDKNADNIITMTHGDFTRNIAPVHDKGVWNFIDRQGKTIISGIGGIENGECTETWLLYGILNGENTAYLIDYNGEKVMGDKVFQKILMPQEKGDNIVYAAMEDGKWGLIDKAGNPKTEFIYDRAYEPRYGWTALEKDGKIGMFDSNGNMVMDMIAENFLIISKKDPQYIWINQNGKYYNYDVAKKTVSKKGYVNVVNNLNTGYAIALPEQQEIRQDAMNRILCGMDPDKNVEEAEFNKAKKYFGYLVDAEDNICFPFLITNLFKSKAEKAVSDNNGKPLTPGQAKACVLQWTKDKRSYLLDETISDDNWDY